jgi:gliding motility-associated-like protein
MAFILFLVRIIKVMKRLLNSALPDKKTGLQARVVKTVVFFALLGIVGPSNALVYRGGFLNLVKINDSTVVAILSAQGGGPVDTVNIAMDFIGIFSPKTQKLDTFKFDKTLSYELHHSFSAWRNPGQSRIIQVKTFNLNDPRVKHFFNQDSLIFVARTTSELGGNRARPTYGSMHGALRVDRLIGNLNALAGSNYGITVASIVYPKNLKSVQSTNNLNFRFITEGRPTSGDAVYNTIGMQLSPRDSVDVVATDLPEFYFGNLKDTFFSGVDPNQNYWLPGYNAIDKPNDIMCLPISGCSFKRRQYPPFGFHVERETGDLAYHVEFFPKDIFPTDADIYYPKSVPSSRKIDHYTLDSQSNFIKCFSYFYVFYPEMGKIRPNGKALQKYNVASRLKNDDRYTYICANDSLTIHLETTAAIKRANSLPIPNWIYWDSAIKNATFTVPNTGYNKTAIFGWRPDNSNIGRMPYSFNLYVHTNDTGETDTRYIITHTNSYTYRVHVVEKQRSTIVLDSIACGKVYVHAEDTLQIPGKWHYQWTLLRNGIAQATDTGKRCVIAAPDSGSYTLELVATPSRGTCPIVRTMTIDIPYFTQKSYELPTVNCAGTAFSLSWTSTGASAFTAFNWQSNETSQSTLRFNGTLGSDTLLYLAALDTIGCSILDTLHVPFYPLPTPYIGEDTTLCAGTALTVSANDSFYSMMWNGSTGVDSFIAVAPAEVVLDVKDSLGCQSSDTLTIQAFQTPIPQLDLKKPCLRDTVRVRFPVRDSLNFNSWVLEGVESNGELVFTADTVNHIGYSFTLDTLGKVCSYSQVDTLESYLLPVFHILAPDTLCASSIPLGFKTTSAVPLNWEEDSIFNPVHAFEKGKLFYTSSIRATAKSVEGCEYRDTSWIQVEYPDTLLFTSWEDRLCPPLNEISLPSTTLHGQGVQYFTNGSGRFEFGKYIPSSSDEALDTLYFTFNNENAKSCKAYNGKRHVEIGPLVRLEEIELIDPKCALYTVQLKADNTSNRKTSWRIDGEEVHQNQELNIDLERGTYHLELWQEEEFCRDSVQSTFTVLDTPDVEVFVLPDELFLKDPVAKLEAIGGGSLTYNWTVTNGFESVENPVLVRFSDTGLYEVRLTAVSEQGCTTKVHDQIRVWEKAVHYIPSAFTPDGDGLNDFFKPSTIGYDRYILEVYNRWGELLFVEKNNGQGWNGMANGEPAPEGIYVYTIKLIQSNGEVLEDSGRVALLRGE